MNKWQEIIETDLIAYVNGKGEFTQSLFDTFKEISNCVINKTSKGRALLSMGETREDLQMIMIESVLPYLNNDTCNTTYIYKSFSTALSNRIESVRAKKRDVTKTHYNIEPEDENDLPSQFDQYAFNQYKSESSGSITKDKEHVDYICDWWENHIEDYKCKPSEKRGIMELIETAREISNGEDRLFEKETPIQRFYPPELKEKCHILSSAMKILSEKNKELNEQET